jgi:hypothetical protein
MISLAEVLSDINERVLNKFRTLYSVSRDDALEIAMETNRWLWLNARLNHDRDHKVPDTPRVLVVHHGMVIIDEYWHAFVLHTRDYQAFCQKHFGFFIHHSPSFPGFQEPTLAETECQLNYIWNVAGEETVVRWYEEYPVKYSADVLARIQKPRRFDQPCEAVP